MQMAEGMKGPISSTAGGSWELKRDFKSPNYTTRISEIPVAR